MNSYVKAGKWGRDRLAMSNSFTTTTATARNFVTTTAMARSFVTPYQWASFGTCSASPSCTTQRRICASDRVLRLLLVALITSWECGVKTRCEMIRDERYCWEVLLRISSNQQREKQQLPRGRRTRSRP